MGLGQGGLSDEPMWDGRVAEVRAIRPRLIRLFIQEYFNLLPRSGRYHFDTLDRSVDTILKAGAKPLMCICFKPEALFPEVNQDRVEPKDYDAVGATRREPGRALPGARCGDPVLGGGQRAGHRRVGRLPISLPAARATCGTIATRRRPFCGPIPGPAWAGRRWPPCDRRSCPRSWMPAKRKSCRWASSPGTSTAAIRARSGRRSTTPKACSSSTPALKPETVLDEWNMDLGNPPLDPRFQPCYVAETIWQMKEAGLDWSCYYHIRDYHVRYEQFQPFLSPQGAAFMTTMVEPDAAVRRAVRLPGPGPAVVFRLQASVASDRPAAAGCFVRSGRSRVCHA